MFTGLIQEVGTIEAVVSGRDGSRLRISTGLGGDIAVGDSIAVNGVCLTATVANARSFEAEVMNQTRGASALSDLEAGASVNLEMAMRASDRLGGHIVQGHVDGVGEVVAVEEDGFARRVRVQLGQDLIRYVVAKGSIALDGVSLTAAELGEDWVGVSLVPETLERTNLGEAAPGRRVNVECDVVAKYVERLVSPLAGKERR